METCQSSNHDDVESKLETVKLSVQGAYFELDHKSFVKHDWMPARMFESTIGKYNKKKHLYLDCDANSFQIIWSILQGVAVVQDYSDEEDKVPLLIPTARYLGCTQIIDELSSSFMKKRDVVDELKSRITALETSQKRGTLTLRPQLKTSWWRIYCDAYRQGRRNNVCNAEVGRVCINGGEGRTINVSELSCPECGSKQIGVVEETD